MKIIPVPQNIIEIEKEKRIELNKWSLIEEIIYKQKARNQWLKVRDSNTKYFFASMKSRKMQNQISMLTKSDGDIITYQQEISREAVGLYQQLLGQANNGMPAAQ